MLLRAWSGVRGQQCGIATSVLVHSPFVGPATWSPVAAEFRSRGHQVAVPSLLASLADCTAQSLAVRAAEATPLGDVVLVGHSGAGLLLPLIAEELRQRSNALVFIDAPLPLTAGAVQPIPHDLLAYLQSVADGGLLPKWSAWFGPTTMARLGTLRLVRRVGVVLDRKVRRSVANGFPVRNLSRVLRPVS